MKRIASARTSALGEPFPSVRARRKGTPPTQAKQGGTDEGTAMSRCDYGPERKVRQRAKDANRPNRAPGRGCGRAPGEAIGMSSPRHHAIQKYARGTRV